MKYPAFRNNLHKNSRLTGVLTTSSASPYGFYGKSSELLEEIQICKASEQFYNIKVLD